MEKKEKDLRYAKAYNMGGYRMHTLEQTVARSRAALEGGEWEDYMFVPWVPPVEKPNAVQSWLEK